MRVSDLRSARLCQFRWSIMLLTYLAALCCTCSSWVTFSFGVWVPYRTGRTRDFYDCSLTVVELVLIFLRRNPSVLFAFVVILFIWLSDCIVTPRYLDLSACSSWCPYTVHEYFTGVLFRVMNSTLGWKAIFHFCSNIMKC